MRWMRIAGCSAAGAAGAARRTIGWRCTTCAGRDLGSCWRWCWHSRWRCRWWCCWCGQCRWFQLDATWQRTAPLACRQAGEQAWSLHAVARRATDLRLGAIVGAIGCTDDCVVVVARQRVALNNCKAGWGRDGNISNWHRALLGLNLLSQRGGGPFQRSSKSQVSSARPIIS